MFPPVTERALTRTPLSGRLLYLVREGVRDVGVGGSGRLVTT